MLLPITERDATATFQAPNLGDANHLAVQNAFVHQCLSTGALSLELNFEVNVR
jgi:hypothetical protein